ncbi:hypothetical protein Tco_0776629, partial [Tanacetum coccineum]
MIYKIGSRLCSKLWRKKRAAFFQQQSDAFEALFGDENNQAVNTIAGDQEDPDSNKMEETDLTSPEMVVAEDLGQKHLHNFDETAMLLMTEKDVDFSFSPTVWNDRYNGSAHRQRVHKEEEDEGCNAKKIMGSWNQEKKLGITLRSAKALYFASVELLDTTDCFFDFQEIRHGPRKMQIPVIDLLVVGQLAQSLS